MTWLRAFILVAVLATVAGVIPRAVAAATDAPQAEAPAASAQETEIDDNDDSRVEVQVVVLALAVVVVVVIGTAGYFLRHLLGLDKPPEQPAGHH